MFENALCRANPEDWFPVGVTGLALARRDTAIATCRVCPELGDCIDYTARVRPVDGIWAGQDHARERRVTRTAVTTGQETQQWNASSPRGGPGCPWTSRSAPSPSW